MGVVDSNAHGSSNVVISHLQAVGYKSVEFIILSHPHRDHYSGLIPLLKFCMESKTRVKWFIHTCKNVHVYLRSFSVPINDKRTLDQVFVSARALRQAGLLEDYFDVDQHFAATLADGVKMSFLAPSTDEYESFIRSLYQDSELTPKRPKENLLSTVIILQTKDWYTLLTSDTERHVLKGVGQRKLRHDWRPMLLGQVPHHGSIHNYSSGFWKNRVHEPGSPVAISVGPNTHGHPSPEVIEKLTEIQFDVQTTYTEPVSTPNIDAHSILALDVISKPKKTASYGRDLIFDLLPDNGN